MWWIVPLALFPPSNCPLYLDINIMLCVYFYTVRPKLTFYNIESINLENLSLSNCISPKFQNLSLTLHCRSLEIPVKVKVESFCGWDQKLISRKSGKVCDSFWWVGEGCQEEEGWVKIAQLSFLLKPELPLIGCYQRRKELANILSCFI